MTIKKTLIVFDIDGTLTDTVPLHKSAFIHALTQLDVREIDDNFNSYLHHTDYHIAKAIYEKDKRLPFTEELEASFEALLFDSINKATFSEIEGARRMIDALEATGAGICYATGSLLRPAVCKLERTGISFDRMQLAASNGIEERENIVKKAIEQAQRFYGQEQFDRIIAVGDGLWDLLTARSLGLEFIGIGPIHRQLLMDHGATRHLNNWLEFNPEAIPVSSIAVLS